MNNNFTTAHDILAELEAKLDKSKRTGDKLTARCPAHEDKTPSLSAKIGENGDCVVVHCFAGCPNDAVLDALGWTMRDLFASDATRPPTRQKARVYVLDPSKLPGVPDPLPKGWGANDWDIPEGVNVREALRGALRSHEARAIGDEADAAKLEASSLPLDTPGNVRLWIDALTDTDLDGTIRVLHLIVESPEWAALVPALRIAVVRAIKGHTATSMATAILGRFDERTLTWRDPPGEAVDTSTPDVMSLATLLADPPDPTATVARGLAFGGTMGFIRGPKASGKTTILAAAAARVSRGQPWAGHPTEAGTVLVVCNDDPRSWVLALRDFDADTERILMARARVVSRPGKLAALLAEHRPVWVIIDNLRTWCGAMQLDTDNSSAAADAIDPIAEAIRECGYPVAATLIHNEARSKQEGVIVKGVPVSPYVGRMRNSTVFEDAADWIVGCAHVDGSTTTTITAGEKTRREIPTETLIIDLDADGHGTPSTGGGGADPFTISAPVNPLDARIAGYLMAHPEGVSQNAVQKAVGGRRPGMVRRLKEVGALGPDNLWRSSTGRKSPEQSHDFLPPEQEITPSEQVRPDAQIGGGGNRDAVGCVPVSPANGTQGGTHRVPTSHPIRDAPSGRTSGTHLGTHLAVPDLVPLAGSENPPPPPPRGGVEPYASIPKLNGRTLFHGDGKMKGVEKMVKHEESCPRCFGTGTDCVGKPCTYIRPPVVQEEEAGTKRWDAASKKWVDFMLHDIGIPNRQFESVHLHPGWTVRDGDQRIHMPLRWNESEEAWHQVGMVH